MQPFLTIILNNGGWKVSYHSSVILLRLMHLSQSPRLSMLAVHPNGLGSKQAADNLSVGFGPDVPDYAQIAVAAGGAWGKKISNPSEVGTAIREAIEIVRRERRCAVLDCVLESI